MFCCRLCARENGDACTDHRETEPEISRAKNKNVRSQNQGSMGEKHKARFL